MFTVTQISIKVKKIANVNWNTPVQSTCNVILQLAILVLLLMLLNNEIYLLLDTRNVYMLQIFKNVPINNFNQ